MYSKPKLPSILGPTPVRSGPCARARGAAKNTLNKIIKDTTSFIRFFIFVAFPSKRLDLFGRCPQPYSALVADTGRAGRFFTGRLGPCLLRQEDTEALRRCLRYERAAQAAPKCNP